MNHLPSGQIQQSYPHCLDLEVSASFLRRGVVSIVLANRLPGFTGLSGAASTSWVRHQHQPRLEELHGG